MKTVLDFSTENMAVDAMFENQQSDSYLQTVGHITPKGDDDNEDEGDDENGGSTDDNPPVDPDVNQAPVVLQPTPKPKDK